MHAETAPPDQYGLTQEHHSFLTETVFVGDSICSGFRVYSILPNDNCVAKGSVGVRNIFENRFPVRGEEFGVTYALQLLAPKYVVFSMGMNDINIITPEEYCAKYDELFAAVYEALPDVKLYVASITPIRPDIQFSSNERINLFNQTMQAHLEGAKEEYLDIATGLKSWESTPPCLNAKYNGGDGIHLAPNAYYVIMKQVCEQLVETLKVGGYGKDGLPYGYENYVRADS